MGNLLEYERDILRHLNGEDVPGLMWGAAMSECIERLYGGGYVSRSDGSYEITESGKAALMEKSFDGEITDFTILKKHHDLSTREGREGALKEIREAKALTDAQNKTGRKS